MPLIMNHGHFLLAASVMAVAIAQTLTITSGANSVAAAATHAAHTAPSVLVIFAAIEHGIITVDVHEFSLQPHARAPRAQSYPITHDLSLGLRDARVCVCVCVCL